MNEKLIKIFVNIFEMEEGDLSDNFSSDTSDHWDSLKQMEIIYAIEEEYDVKFEALEILELNSYEKIKNKLQDL